MDKKTIMAFLLSFIIIFTYPYYLKMISHQQDTTKNVIVKKNSTVNARETEKDAFDDVRVLNTVSYDKKEYFLENKRIRIKFSNLGAKAETIELLSYKLSLSSNENIFILRSGENGTLGECSIGQNTGVYYNKFDIAPYSLVSQSDNKLVFLSPTIDGIKLKKTYSLDVNSYSLHLNMEIINTTQKDKNIFFKVSSAITYDTTNSYNKRFVSWVVWDKNKFIVKSLAKINRHPITLQKELDWFVLEEKYFMVLFKPYYSVTTSGAKNISDDTLGSYTVSKKYLLSPASSLDFEALYYIGPRDRRLLKSFKEGFEDVLARGMLGWLRGLLLSTLHFFFKYTRNYGVSIILLTILIKIIFAPLTHKSFKSMKKMQELQPQMKALQEKYKDDPQQLNKEVMELYKKHKANPFGGCFPILLQMPIFIALYQTLSRSIALKGAPFVLWIRDLSAPDSIPGLPFHLNVLPILMIVSMIVQQKMAPSTATKEQQKMFLFMPLIFGVMFYNLPSGLVLYWLVNNVITIVQQSMIKR